MRLQVTGALQVTQALRLAAKRYPGGLNAALYQEGFGIHAAAVRRAPVEFGVLRSSAYVSPPAGERDPVVEIGFGTHYAIRQHEELHYEHPRGGEAKYLQKAVDERSSGMEARLADNARKNAEKGISVSAIPAAAPKQPRTTGGGRRFSSAAARVRKATKRRK